MSIPVNRTKNAAAMLALVVSAFGLHGCGSSGASHDKPTTKQWRADAEARIGHSFASDALWKKYQDVFVGEDGFCNSENLDIMLAVFVDGGSSVSDIEQDIKFAFPDKLPDLHKAAKSLQESASKADRICSTDPDLLSQEDKDFYDAVC